MASDLSVEHCAYSTDESLNWNEGYDLIRIQMKLIFLSALA